MPPETALIFDPMPLVLGASGFFGVVIALRFVAAVMLPPGHRLRRAGEAIDAPLWSLEAEPELYPAQHPAQRPGAATPEPARGD
jgi:hypothetical protein